MPSGPDRVAVITGGCRGIGLAVAQALDAKGGWKINLIDIRDDEGKQAAESLSNATYHRANLTNYDEVTAAFKSAFVAGKNRLDFVFANAGIIESSNLFAKHDSIDGPPPPDFAAVEINLKGCINTVHVGRHYINLSPGKGSIVINASSTSFWPAYWAPIYTASKFGILGFMRTVADSYKLDGVRVNALCPGAVRTHIVPDRAWDSLPVDVFTPLSIITDTVLKLAEGAEIVDANGTKATSDELFGKAVVANGKNIYIQPETAYCDDVMERTIENTRMGKQTAL
ncbi:hypothetical protein KVR01_006305 [Diaporthe batatas]|uniref:uncharacterized protein n=1 Tax=Diaporthe batatas TaxID=748121 RepID=UPI001D049655|nr:uncharacterized protein KVR01_006305 [Diaporthe batatas]KAG8164387.1 hypothetical protein KVR01_006305 [Diaporthe batatas]